MELVVGGRGSEVVGAVGDLGVEEQCLFVFLSFC